MTAAAPVPVDCLAEVRAESQGLFTAFAMLRNVREGRTSQGKRYVDLELGDQSATVGGKIWEDQAGVQDAALLLPTGRPVKVMFAADSYKGAVQLKVLRLREVNSEDAGSYRAAAVYGEGIDLVEDLLCETLVFDIETVPAHDRRELPATVAEALAKYAEHKDMETAAVMGMSPFFGKVVSLALGEGECKGEGEGEGEGKGEGEGEGQRPTGSPAAGEQRVTALVVLPDDADPLAEYPAWMRPMSEADLLRAFWALAGAARTVVTFNGRGFDVPFLINRSLVHGVPARVDLMGNRYALRPHLDLLQVVRHGNYGGGPSNLDVVCWALGIASPKGQMDGSMVAPANAKGQIEAIASYNLADVRATTAVYQKLCDGLLRFRKDW
jgi:predicted PolB exonuclease-like 3'-5' exonuclease